VGDYTYFLANSLAGAGYEVEILTGVGNLDDSLYPLHANVRVHRVIENWGVGGLNGMVSFLRTMAPQALIVQYSPHSFDRRGITLAINLLPILLRASSGIRVVANFHELYIPFGRSIKRGIGAAWQRTAAILLASSSHALSATAGEWQRRLSRMGIRKQIRVIPVGSNVPRVGMGDEERCGLRRQFLGREDGLLVVGFGARHDRDIPATLAAIRLLKTHISVKLIWIGGGDADDRHSARIDRALKMNELTEDDVQWTGVLPHPEISRLLSASDLMILPFIDGVSSRRTTAVTALQHGLPLLTTRGHSPEPWFVHGQNVYLTPAGDIQGLADALVELAQKPESWGGLAYGARELYDERFAWGVIAEQVASLVR
jgi:glycosyltransferase involved in cell wall biosynthesis